MKYMVLAALVAVAAVGCGQEVETDSVQQVETPVASTPMLEGKVGSQDVAGEATMELQAFESEYATIKLIREELNGAGMLVMHFEGQSANELAFNDRTRVLLCSGATSDQFNYDREADLINIDASEIPGGVHYEVQAVVYGEGESVSDSLAASFDIMSDQ